MSVLSSSTIGQAIFGEAVWNLGVSTSIVPTVIGNLKHPLSQLDTLNLYPLSATGLCNITPVTSSFNYAESSTCTGSVDANYAVKADRATIIQGESSSKTKISTRYTKMVRWDAFHEYIMPHVQGCPVSMVNSALRSACIEFCEKSFIWKQASIENDLIEGMYNYTFAPPLSAKVVTAYRVSIDGVELQPTDLQTLETFTPYWRDTVSNRPEKYFFEADDTIRVVGIPSETKLGALKAEVILKPSRSADNCPNFLYTDWAETIAAGALTRLYAMQGKIWAKPDLVSHFSNIFKAGISRARSKSAKSWQQESKAMLPVDFYVPNKRII